MPGMARGWGWRSPAGSWRRTPAPSCWKTASRARRRSALRCRNRSRFCHGGRLLPAEDVHVDIIELPDQRGGRIPGPPPPVAASEDDLGVQRLTQVACERRGHISPVETDELTAVAVDEGRVLAEPATLLLRKVRRANADHGKLRRHACGNGRHPPDAGLHPG